MAMATAEDLVREVASLTRQAMTSRSPEKLGSALSDGCWIYGAGGYGRTIRALLEAAGIEVKGFIDRRGIAADADGRLRLSVARPDEIDLADVRTCSLVLGLHNFAVDQRPVVDWAREAGFRDVITPSELVDMLGASAGSYWLTGRRHVHDNIERVRALWAMLADDKSRLVLAGLARFRATGRPDFHPASCLDDQYFPSDLPPPPGAATLLDGGAYVGDTHAAALRNGVTIAEWLAFEPDPDNFGALARYAAGLDIGRAALFPCGLSDRLRIMRFAGEGGAGSREAGDGETNVSTVQVVAADDVLPAARPTLVKLDVEGHERQALDGMRTLISRNRPRLAISIYHRPEDLWELPAKLAEMVPGARLYIRQHGFSGFDTVCYAFDD